MTDLQKEIEKAFQVISAIPVSGDMVEVMALAREHLRKAFDMAGGKKEGENG